MPQKQPSYSPTPTQATQGPGGGGGEPKNMAGAPGAQNMMGGLFGGLLGGSRQGNVTPTSVKGFMPSGGGGLLGGLLGATRYTSIRDMFNGGGPGRAGERFYGGGMLSAGLNRAGVRPAGYQGVMAAMASQAARKAAQPGYTPTGTPAAPTGGLGAPAGAPAASGGLGAPAGAPMITPGAPLLGSGMTPANAYATTPVAPMTYGPQTRPNVTPGLSYGPQARYANYRAPQLAQTQVPGFPSTPPLVAVPGQYFPQFPNTVGMGRVPPGQPYSPGPERSWTYGQPAEAYREMMVNRYLPTNTSTVPVPRGAGALAQPYLPAVTR